MEISVFTRGELYFFPLHLVAGFDFASSIYFCVLEDVVGVISVESPTNVISDVALDTALSDGGR